MLSSETPLNMTQILEVMQFPNPDMSHKKLYHALHEFINMFCQHDPVFASLEMPPDMRLQHGRELYEYFDISEQVCDPEVDNYVLNDIDLIAILVCSSDHHGHIIWQSKIYILQVKYKFW